MRNDEFLPAVLRIGSSLINHSFLTYLAIHFLATIIPTPVVIQSVTPTALIVDVNASGKNLRPTIMKIMPKPTTHHSLLGIAPPGIALRSWVKRL
jgi:hypothetical protein